MYKRQVIEFFNSSELVDYKKSIQLMEKRVENIKKKKQSELLWFLEHPSIYTAGTSSKDKDLLNDNLFPVIKNLYQQCNNIIFIPFARPNGISHDLYTKHVKATFNKIGLNISGINESNNTIDSIKKCDGIFIGGGNSLELLYDCL